MMKIHVLSLLAATLFAQTQNPNRVPLVGTALSCGKTTSVGGLAAGSDLQRYDFDNSKYPYAMCNDGSPAIFYFRPAQTAANRNKWLIELQGGGSCGTANDCANRWCGVDTNFSATGMSSNYVPKPSVRDGGGIFERRADNPVGGWNHVLAKYCSSDTWSGTAKDVLLDADDPITKNPVLIRMHFLGSKILDATFQALRRSGGETLRYGLASPAVDMPNLDDAEMIVFSGTSGGGNGVTKNLDRIAALLRQTNNNCRGQKTCPLQIRGLFDSAFAPSIQSVDLGTSVFCPLGLCTPQSLLEFEETEGAAALWKAKGDQSCPEWHRKNAPDLEWRCNDEPWLLLNHVTTPFFVRMGQTDQLTAKNFIAAQFSVPATGQLLNLESYAGLIREQVLSLANVKKDGNEGADLSMVPGAFSPTCSDHETLGDSTQVYGVRIRVGNTQQGLTMFEVFQNWLDGKNPSILAASNPQSNTCPGN